MEIKGQSDPNALTPLKVVLIDDDPTILKLLKILLSARGFEVVTFESASSSPFMKGNDKQVCPCPNHPHCPDVVVADVDMPGMKGIDFLRHLNQRGCRCRHLAIMTGYGVEEADMTKLAKFGARVFLKPFESHELTTWLDRVNASRSPSGHA